MSNGGKRRSVRRIALAVAAVAMLGFCSYRGLHHTPRALEHAFVAPKLEAVPDSLKVCWAEYATQSVSGQLGTAGWSKSARWNVTVSGLVVRHPKGDVVIDVGNSSRFAEELQNYPFLKRFVLMQGPGSNTKVASAPDALRARGVDPAALFGIVVSHAHIDHVGGIGDMPTNVPLFLSQAEIDFVETRGVEPNLQVVPAHAKAMHGRMKPIVFEKKPYETFDESADLFGDGSVVVVPLPGHTPGSIGTFVNLAPDRRALHVGDTINLREAYERRVGKSLAMSWTDDDSAGVEASVSKLAQLHELDPSLQILPAHDRDAWSAFFRSDGPTCIGAR